MKLLVSDFDGTFYLDDVSIKDNIKRINKWIDDGNLFMLSSGRSFTSLKNMCLKYNIKYDYLSCCDGSILYDKDGNIVSSYSLNNSILKDFLSLETLAKIDRIQYSYYDDYYSELRNDELIGCNIVIENENITDLFKNEFNNLKNSYQDFDFLVYAHDDVTYFCLKNKGINKSTTVSYLMEKHNLDKENIYTVGDNDNDYPMLNLFNGYYIGNPNERIINTCLRGYNFVHELIDSIENDY